MNCILEKFPGNFGDPRVICSVMNGSPTGEEGMTPPLAHDPPNAAPDEGPAGSPLTAVAALAVVAGRRRAPALSPLPAGLATSQPPGAPSPPPLPDHAGHRARAPAALR